MRTGDQLESLFAVELVSAAGRVQLGERGLDIDLGELGEGPRHALHAERLELVPPRGGSR